MADGAYTEDFYNLIREGCQSSAAAVVPLVCGHFPDVKTVVDVGCGEGWWGKAFESAGCEVMGVDGDYIEAPVIPFAEADLATQPPRAAVYDLAVCLEVAEHLPPERAASFIADLCKAAPVVLFSAAIPGQGGADHLNEQWPAYWVERFEAQGFSCSGALRWAIWDDESVENWYRQNLIVAARDPEACPALFKSPLAPVWPVVHPILFDARRA